MKAPDKIYVLLDKTSGFFSHTFTNIPCNYGGDKQDIEYIRKDYLLEWAEKLYEMYVRITEQGNNDIDFGRMNAFSMLINKLNEL